MESGDKNTIYSQEDLINKIANENNLEAKNVKKVFDCMENIITEGLKDVSVDNPVVFKIFNGLYVRGSVRCPRNYKDVSTGVVKMSPPKKWYSAKITRHFNLNNQ